MKVIVTGAGALLGQGIIRSLHRSSLRPTIIALDPDPDAAGFCWADRTHVVPLANDPAYLRQFEQLLCEEQPNVVFFGTDVELPVVSSEKERLQFRYQTTLILSGPRVVNIANDKWQTNQFFCGHGFDHPKTCLADDREGLERLITAVGYPLIVKPRIGSRSRGVSLVHNQQHLDRALAGRRHLIVQECVGTPELEFTAGTLTFDGRCQASIVMRREIRDGNTFKAYVDSFPNLNKTVKAWATALQPFGPANFQFRMRGESAVAFEINARFSGTTPIRAQAGFNEVEMTLSKILHQVPVSQPEIKPMTVVRYWSEVVMVK
jgi:carbamoyl-phosphate synthase large subunit